MMGYTDEERLVRSVANGDRKAFAIVYSQYLHNLYRYIYLFTRSKEMSEEIVQTVFVKIWERRERLVHVNSFKSYLYRTAKNLLLDEIRRNKVEKKACFTLKPHSEECHERADDKIIYTQYYNIAQDAINLLPEKRKRIVELRLMDDLTLDEIAQKLGISKGVVKKQLYSGLHFIREYLQKNAEISHVFIPFLMLFVDAN